MTITTDQDRMESRKRIPGWMLIVAICLVAVAHIWWLAFVCDDAFISFRYADNLVDGHGMVFNPGERVEGYTNFLWVAICALVISLGGAPEVWSAWIGGAMSVGLLGAMMWMLLRCRRDFFFAGILLALNGGFAAWATGGLETGLFTALTGGAFCALVAAIDRPDHSYGRPLVLLSSPLLLLAAWTRPEGVFVTGLVGVFLLASAVRKRLSWGTFVLWALMWLVPYSGYFVWRFLYFGQVFPNTFYVKATGTSMIPHGIEYVLFAMRRFHVYLLLLPGAILLALRRDWGVNADVGILGLSIVVPYVAYVCAIGGDFMDMFRFLVPILPIVFVLIGASWRGLFEYLSSRFSRNAALTATGALLAVAVILNLHTSWDSQKVWFRHGLDSIGLLRQYREDWSTLAQQLRQVSQPTDSIAITAAGIIPYYTGLYTIDQLGLVAPDLRDYVVRDEPRAGHAMLLSGEAMFRLMPQFILGHPRTATVRSELTTALFIGDEWFDRITANYRTLTIQLSTDPPRFSAYVVRMDVTERVPESPSPGQ